MLDYLLEIYTNLYLVRESEVKYYKLRIGLNDSFYDFKTRFLYLSNEARIPTASRFYRLYNKLPTKLRTTLAPMILSFDRDL